MSLNFSTKLCFEVKPFQWTVSAFRQPIELGAFWVFPVICYLCTDKYFTRGYFCESSVKQSLFAFCHFTQGQTDVYEKGGEKEKKKKKKSQMIKEMERPKGEQKSRKENVGGDKRKARRRREKSNRRYKEGGRKKKEDEREDERERSKFKNKIEEEKEK